MSLTANKQIKAIPHILSNSAFTQYGQGQGTMENISMDNNS